MKPIIVWSPLALIFAASFSFASLKSMPASGGHFNQACSDAEGAITSSMYVVTLHRDDDTSLTLYPTTMNVEDIKKADITFTEIQTLNQETFHGSCGAGGGSSDTVYQVTIQKKDAKTGDADLDQELQKGLKRYMVCKSLSFGSPVPCSASSPATLTAK